jgi:PiT family inorganic phosphate transporter
LIRAVSNKPSANPTATPPAISLTRLALIGAFLLCIAALAFIHTERLQHAPLVLVAVLIGAYLALNIGANDSANNIGTAVGSGALTLTSAMLLAVIGELAGAFFAGDPVNARLRETLFHPSILGDGPMLSHVLIAGMLAGALWLHLATVLRLPVSATHSVIGGLLGAALFARGWNAVQWDQIGSIALIWLTTPLLSAFIAGLALYTLERTVSFRPDLIGAARKQVPILTSLLSFLLADYFFVTLAPPDWRASQSHLLASLAVAVAIFLISQPRIHRMAQQIKNNRQGVNQLFDAPLVLAAGFFAFAHGANDVANITAPLTSVIAIATAQHSPGQFMAPFWVLATAALGIAAGLLIYGSRLIRTVGSEITEIDKLRAFCIALSAATVVLTASHFGFPVSTTHTLIGSIFGVGLLREFIRLNDRKTLEKIRKCYAGEDRAALEQFLRRYQGATLPRKRDMLDGLYQERGKIYLSNKELKTINEAQHRELLKHTLFKRIIGFWLLTIPAAALLGGILYRTVAWLPI